MAQVPWEVISSQKVSVPEAQSFGRRCVRDLSKRPKGVKAASHVGGSTVQCLPSLQTFVEEIAPVETGSFHVLTARGTVVLHPCWQDAADFGSRMYLSNYLLKFVPEFQGIWVAFGKIAAKDDAGFIADGELWVMSCFEIEVECLVFRPAPGKILVGKVNQVRPSHVGLLVDGIFNACVRRKVGLHKRFELDAKNAAYRSLDPEKASLRIGDLLAFKISKYHYSTNGDISTLEGSILDTAITGVVNRDGSLKSAAEEIEQRRAAAESKESAAGEASGSSSSSTGREGEPKKKRRKADGGGDVAAVGTTREEGKELKVKSAAVVEGGVKSNGATERGARSDAAGADKQPAAGAGAVAGGQKRSRTSVD